MSALLKPNDQLARIKPTDLRRALKDIDPAYDPAAALASGLATLLRVRAIVDAGLRKPLPDPRNGGVPRVKSTTYRRYVLSALDRTVIQAHQALGNDTTFRENLDCNEVWSELLKQPPLPLRDNYSKRMAAVRLAIAIFEKRIHQVGKKLRLAGRINEVPAVTGLYKLAVADIEATAEPAALRGLKGRLETALVWMGLALPGLNAKALGMVKGTSLTDLRQLPDSEEAARELRRAMVAMYAPFIDAEAKDDAERRAGKALTAYRTALTRLDAKALAKLPGAGKGGEFPRLTSSRLFTRGIRSIPNYEVLARVAGIKDPAGASVTELVKAIAPRMAGEVRSYVDYVVNGDDDGSKLETKMTRPNVFEADHYTTASWWLGLIDRFNRALADAQPQSQRAAGLLPEGHIDLRTVRFKELFTTGGAMLPVSKQAKAKRQEEEDESAKERRARKANNNSRTTAYSGAVILRLMQFHLANDTYRGNMVILKGQYISQAAKDHYFNAWFLVSRQWSDDVLKTAYLGKNDNMLATSYPDMLPALDTHRVISAMFETNKREVTLDKERSGRQIKNVELTAADLVCRALPQMWAELDRQWKQRSAKGGWANDANDRERRFLTRLTYTMAFAFGLAVCKRPQNHGNTLIGRHLVLTYKNGKLVNAAARYWGDDEFEKAHQKVKGNPESIETVHPSIVPLHWLERYLEIVVAQRLVVCKQIANTAALRPHLRVSELNPTGSGKLPPVAFFPTPTPKQSQFDNPDWRGEIAEATYSRWFGRGLHEAFSICGVKVPEFKNRGKEAWGCFSGHPTRHLNATWYYGVKGDIQTAMRLLGDKQPTIEKAYIIDGTPIRRRGSFEESDPRHYRFYEKLMDLVRVESIQPAKWTAFWAKYNWRQPLENLSILTGR